MSTYTRGDAAGLLALAIGVPNKDWLSGWSSHEIGCGVGCRHPQNNLWACGQAAPGATDYNSAGVKNYPSLVEAIAATAANLHSAHHPEYGWMIHDLQQGKTDSDNIRAGLRTWCGSTCYSNEAANFVAAGKAHNADPFDDSGGTVGSNIANLTNPCDQLNTADKLKCNSAGCDTIKFPAGTDPGTKDAIIHDCKACVVYAIQHPGSGTPDQCVKEFAGQAGASPGFPGTDALCGILPGWICNPDWGRVIKAVLGVLLIGFGFLLLFALLTEKAEGNPAVKAVTKAVALGA